MFVHDWRNAKAWIRTTIPIRDRRHGLNGRFGAEPPLRQRAVNGAHRALRVSWERRLRVETGLTDLVLTLGPNAPLSRHEPDRIAEVLGDHERAVRSGRRGR